MILFKVFDRNVSFNFDIILPSGILVAGSWLQSLTVTIFDMGLIFFDEGLDQIFNGAFPGAFGIVCRRPTTNKIICLGAMCCFSSNLGRGVENRGRNFGLVWLSIYAHRHFYLL